MKPVLCPSKTGLVAFLPALIEPWLKQQLSADDSSSNAADDLSQSCTLQAASCSLALLLDSVVEAAS